MNWQELLKTKTFWAALPGVVVSVAGLFGAVAPDVVKTMDTVCAFLAIIFIRDGMISAGK